MSNTQPKLLRIVDTLLPYFPELTPLQREQFAALGPLYAEWNGRINVISRKDIDQLYTRHVLHSLAIARVCRFAANAQVMDVGCGGGFPGIPLAILFPESRFTLVDSIGKKIRVVDEVARAIGLTNVTPLNTRAEQVDGTFDFVVSRAVTDMRSFIGWTWNKLASGTHAGTLPNGILYLKGGDLSNELKASGHNYMLTDISTLFADPFFETKKVVYIPR